MTDHWERPAYSRTTDVLMEVAEERSDQDLQWGVQDFPFHHPQDGRGVALTGRSYAVWASMHQAECDRRRDAAMGGEADTRSYALVLLEEVFEALAETDLLKIREELIQVAAVAVKSVEAIDRARASGRTAFDKSGAVRMVSELHLPEISSETSDDRPTAQEVHDAERVTASAFAPDDVVAAADKIILRAGVAGIRPGPRADLVTTHRYNGAGRLHGICRCGQIEDAPVHDPGAPG